MNNTVGAEYSAADPLTVLVADDHALIREGIKMLVLGMLGTVRFFEVDNGHSLMRAASVAADLRLAVVDLRMPGMQGGLRLLELAQQRPGVPLVVVSGMDSPDIVRRTLEIPSVYAFVPKSAESGHVRAAIEAALHGKKLSYVPAPSYDPHPEIALTPRQQEIRNLLRQGMRNKMIARTLGISEGTVKNHISDIFRALKATNRTQAAQLGSDAEEYTDL